MMHTIGKNNKSGFTLVELVIVVVLIGVLAAMAMPKFGSLTGQAQTNANSMKTSINSDVTDCQTNMNAGGVSGITVCGNAVP